MRFTKFSLAFAVVLMAAAAANAQPHPGGGGTGSNAPHPGGGNGDGEGAPAGTIRLVTPEILAQLFNAAGFQSQVIENNKAKMVKTVFWTPSTFGGAIPEACDKNGGCHAFKIFANLGKAGVDQNWINAWNSRYYYVRAYTDNGNLIFAWDLALFSGLTPDYIESAVKVFKTSVDGSTDFKP